MDTTKTYPPSVPVLNAAQAQTLADFNNPWKLSFWLFYKLPAAWFMGVRVKQLTTQQSIVRLPYAWRSQNPFKSIYFGRISLSRSGKDCHVGDKCRG